MKTVSLDQVGREELALPPRVQEALGQLVGSAKEGLLALSVGVGLGELVELLEEEVDDAVGPKGSTTGSGSRCGMDTRQAGDPRWATRAGRASAGAHR
jgi:hypothetical protein